MSIPIAISVYSKAPLLSWIETDKNSEIFFYGLLLVLFYTAGANTINDVFDIKTDKINKPHRPLASNQVQKKHAIYLYVLLFMCGFFCSIKTNINTIYFSNLIILPLIIFYTPVLKNIPILGNLIVSFVLASVFLFVQLLITNTIIDYSLFALAFSFSCIREIGKDMADVDGDRHAKINTFSALYNLQKSMYFIYFFTSLNILTSIWILIISEFNCLYLISLISAVYAPLFVSIFSLQKTLNIQAANQFSKTTKGITAIGMLTILLLEIKVI